MVFFFRFVRLGRAGRGKAGNEVKHTVPLNENRHFRRLYRTGTCTATPYAALYIKRNRLGRNRLGITATKKLGNAVQRNRARRLVKEAYRLLEDRIPPGSDIVVVVRKKTVYAKMQQVRDSLEKVLCG